MFPNETFQINLQDLISLNFTIENVTLSDFSISTEEPELFNFVDTDRMILSIGGFKWHINADYKYITDPPILADIGSISYSSDNLTFSIDGTNTF